jgi:hypothetical protein
MILAGQQQSPQGCVALVDNAGRYATLAACPFNETPLES